MKRIKVRVDERDNKGNLKLILEDEVIGKINYKIIEDLLSIEHTEVNQGYRGYGIGKKLVSETIKYSQSKNLLIKSECKYAIKILKDLNR